METEDGGIPVRRTARARKVNPRFVGDDIDESYMKLVGRITAANYSRNNKDAESLKESDLEHDKDVPSDSKDESSKCDTLNKAGMEPLTSATNSSVQNVLTFIPSSKCGTSVNITLKTVSFKKKKIKKSEKGGKLLLPPPGQIVQCRSSTESEVSEGHADFELDRKRKALDVNLTNTKKQKNSSDSVDNLANFQSNKKWRSLSDCSVSIPVNDKVQGDSSVNPNTQSMKNILPKSFVPISFSSKIDTNQTKILLTSKPKLDLPGKKLKIVSLKPIATIKERPTNVQVLNSSSSESFNNQLLLNKGGPVELKIVKKDVQQPLNTNVNVEDKNVREKENKTPLTKEQELKHDQSKSASSSSNIFSSDGEDDIPLNKLIEKHSIPKKKKVSKEVKVKKKVNKFLKSPTGKSAKSSSTKNVNDQDDLPLKLLLKKSKSFSKGLSDKLKSNIRKKHKLKMEENLIKKAKSKSKDSGVKGGINNPLIKKTKKKSVEIDSDNIEIDNSHMKTSESDQSFKKKKKKAPESKIIFESKKVKKMKELKSKNQNLKSMQNKNESKFKKRDKGDDKSFKKFRFKFPTKKQVKKDAPLSNETTNIVISVSGLEGDYACVAIDKDHLPSENDNSFNVKPKSKKKKTVSNDNTSKMYASESGLVLEENVIENFDLKESIDYDNPQKAEEKKKELDSSESNKKFNFIPEANNQKNAEDKKSKQTDLNKYVNLTENRLSDQNLEDKLSVNKSETQNICCPDSKDYKDNSTKLVDARIEPVEREQEELGKKGDVSDSSDTKYSVEIEKYKDNMESTSMYESPDVSDIKEENNPIFSLNDGDKAGNLSNLAKENISEGGIYAKESGELDSNKDEKEISKFNDTKTEGHKKKKEYIVNKGDTSPKKQKETSKIEQNIKKQEKESSKNKLLKKHEKEITSLSPKKVDKESTKSKLELVHTPKKEKEQKGGDTSLTSKKLEGEHFQTNTTFSNKIEIKTDPNSSKTDTCNKGKRKENFEEALSNIPLPKLSKHKSSDSKSHEKKKDKEDKFKKSKEQKRHESKDIKPDSNFLNKYKDYITETSKKDYPKNSKSESPNIKSEASYKEMKKEKERNPDEKKHSKSEKKRSETDNKEEIKIEHFTQSSHDSKDKKRKREDRERRHSSSHKKHKKDKDHHESRRRSHSSSHDSKSKEKKQKLDDHSKLEKKCKEESKPQVKEEDNKEIIINRIIDPEINDTCNKTIKHEKDSSENSSEKREQNELNKAPKPSIIPKSEIKPELLIEEENIRNLNNSYVKEEIDSNVIDITKTTNHSFTSNLKTENFSNNQSCDVAADSKIDLVVSDDLYPVLNSANNAADSIVHSNKVELEHEKNNVIHSPAKERHLSRESDGTSDLGILEELRNLKEMKDSVVPEKEENIKQEGKDILVETCESNIQAAASKVSKGINYDIKSLNQNMDQTSENFKTEVDTVSSGDCENLERMNEKVQEPLLTSKMELIAEQKSNENIEEIKSDLLSDNSKTESLLSHNKPFVVDIPEKINSEGETSESITLKFLESEKTPILNEDLQPQKNLSNFLEVKKTYCGEEENKNSSLENLEAVNIPQTVLEITSSENMSVHEVENNCNKEIEEEVDTQSSASDRNVDEDTSKDQSGTECENQESFQNRDRALNIFSSNSDLSSIPLPDQPIPALSPNSKNLENISAKNSLESQISKETLQETILKARKILSNDKENSSPNSLENRFSCEAIERINSNEPVLEKKELTPEEKEEREKRNKEIVEERMNSFEILDENLYLVERVKNKRSKEAKRMVCDCTLTKEEISTNEMGCGEDCLNRLLMIECGSRCPLKDRCMNKKFQSKSYAEVEVFNAEEKGCGVRACEDIKQGTFIMEYIGEVFDTKEFKRRRKEYAKESNAHFYFMALRPDRLIDATRKGNISRFINHSCSPNAETQKWTVNGDIRIGFFSTKQISAGEEINFDYRLERYGREPQRCFCGTSECRGWLGEPPDQKTKEEKEEDRRKELKDRLRREGRRFFFEDMDLEDEIEKLTVRGLRNRQDTLNLSRLMVRCEDSSSRLSLLKILESGEEASRRLFLDYHGLKLLWSWMVDISSSHKCIPLKLEILKTLRSLPITNKTQVTESKIMNMVERWSKAENSKEAEIDKSKVTEGTTDKKLSDGSEDSDTEASEAKDSDPSPSDTVSPDDSSQDSSEAVAEQSAVAVTVNKEESESRDSSDGISISEGAVPEERVTSQEEEETSVSELASKLLTVWINLKEAFKIPKKQRIEMMKEHEREVDQEYEKYLDKKRDSLGDRAYDRWKCQSGDRDRQRNRERRRDRDKRWPRREDEEKGLSKEERRERFAKQVAKEDEEARQRKFQEEMWTLHIERCALLGHDPYFTPMFDPSGQYYWDPSISNWQPYSGPSGNLPVPASYGINTSESSENIPPGQMFLNSNLYTLPNTPVSDGEPTQHSGIPEEETSISLDPASIPLPGETPLPKDSSPETPVVAIPLPGEGDDMDIETISGIETPPLAPPGPVTIKLPPKWKMARDNERRIYFYHTKTRHSQWDLPTNELHAQLMVRYGLTSDSESDPESDSDSTSSSDSEDFSSDEDDNEEEEVVVPAVQKGGDEVEKMIRRPKGKKVRSEKLVQERVISPILFEDREAARRERKEAKERAREEARKERWNVLKALKTGSEVVASAKSQSEAERVTLSEDTVASPNEEEDDEHLEEQLIKYSRKQKSEGKSHTKAKSKERAATALADTSDLARKIKDNFRSRMATYIVSVLNPYRKSDCKEGRITSNEDFKYLARKLTHFVMVKELKQLPCIDELDCNESVKHKTKEFVRKYMSKYGETFKRDPNDTKEY